MRARYPDADGYIERDGVKVFYEVFGEGGPTGGVVPLLAGSPTKVSARNRLPARLLLAHLH